MAECITCGATLHPERAQKYSYCMARECQEKNATGLTMVAVGMNKAADELMILDERTREDLASGKYRDQRRGTFGPAAPAPGPRSAVGGAGSAAVAGSAGAAAGSASGAAGSASGAAGSATGAAGSAGRSGRGTPSQRPRRSPAPAPAPAPARRPWSRRQEKLALLYNERGLRPAEIADKLGLSAYMVTQIILAARNRAKG
jgi:hypothetical protein